MATQRETSLLGREDSKKQYGSVQYEKLADGPEKEGKDKDKEEELKPLVAYSALFQYADGWDMSMVFLGAFFALIHGALIPLFPIVFGNIVDSFGSEEDLRAATKRNSLTFVILGGASFISSYLQLALLLLSSQRQANRIRKMYFHSLLRQEIGWYDKNDSGELLTHIAGDILLIQEGMGEKLGSFLQFLAMFLGGFFVGFFYGWQLALVILSVTPLLMICGAFLGKLMAEFTTKGQKQYAQAGGIAEEVISCIRTVVAFGGENSEIARYGEKLIAAMKEGEKGGHLAGVGLGITFGIMFCSYGLAFWFGSRLIEQGKMEAGDVTTVFFSIIMGAMAIGQATPNLSNFASARGAAVHVFEVIQRLSAIDALSDGGLKPEYLKGNIQLQDVRFTYPSRPEAQILKGIDLEVETGSTVALVGASGCGKSTVISLLQRFYDAESGKVMIDGRDIQEYSLKWLRSQIGVVNQEPVLFAKSIKENIALGKVGASMDEVIAAAKKANAHDFITRLPLGYDTLVGERGAQLSGGQKQRVAIARAIIRDPRILLLDEATSALDAESERVVQAALDEASVGRTTIVVAHRLSTIRNASSICVFDQGLIAERGTHDQLMALEGIYYHLVQRQAQQSHQGEGSSKEDKEKRELRRLRSSGQEGRDLGEADKKGISTSGVVWRTIKLNAKEWPFILVGTVASFAAGLVFPLFSLIFSSMLNDLLTLQGEELKEAVRFWSLAFVFLGVLTGVSNYFQAAMFAVSGERLTERMRRMLFRAIVRQDVAWFDDKANSTGVLTTKLSNDASLVKGVTGQRMGSVFQIISILSAGLTIALFACWQLTLAVAAVIPVIAASGALRMRLMMGFSTEVKKAYEQSGHIASEAIENIRTVSSLGRQETFIDDYNEILQAPEKQGVRGAWLGGLGFGFAEMMTFLIWAFAFWYGTELFLDGKTDFESMMKAISAVVFGASMLGQIIALTPDYSKAKIAAASIYQIVDRETKVDAFSREGLRPQTVRGALELHNLEFSYPARPDVKVLSGLSIEVKPGETLALVGASGCGKSTVISLLERFYQPQAGSISLDGTDISLLNVSWLRNQIGIVGQEPVLFATSIKENIAYGKPDATDDEIVQAAKLANAHTFISTLPKGYTTQVGEKGAQLSGGQKQRVAIARALVRNPRILLLDEATSALDAESEKVVQEALDKAREGRTTIVIAHRLSTIRNASCIAVVEQGRIVERGTHAELMEVKGAYYHLVQTQVNPL